MKKRLITSALPYVNNIPHLGNLIQVLSADVFARFCRSRGYETLYVCGTDEYGTATETRAREEGVTPQELCTRYYQIHTEIYQWFQIAFDKWGRTSTPEQTAVVQDIFLKLHGAGYITERTIEQLYSEPSKMFLADRYVRGTCPKCGYDDARGDQCDNCGSLLDPMELIDPRSAVDGSTPVVKETTHLYIDLPAILPKLQGWMSEASVRGRWARNAVQMTQAWIRDGLKERAITRDLNWGIPVPLKGFEDKVFYVWFDAPIGYISITATLTDQWEQWWKNPDEVELFQFIGKDNIPFHTVIFPSSLLGSGDNWTMLHHMSSSEYLNYEGGQFSKSRGVGVFGTDARETGIPADVWRFYMFYNRPETSDYTFTWKDFQEKVNGELIGNLANLVNRTLTFVNRYYDGVVLERRESETPFWQEVRQREGELTEKLEWAGLRDGLRRTLELSSFGNRTFQAAEPWRTRTTEPEETHQVLSDLVHLIRDLAILTEPYMPATAARIAAMLGLATPGAWAELGASRGVQHLKETQILFQQLPDELIEDLRARFAGTQAERAQRENNEKTRETTVENETTEQSLPERFAGTIELKAARITAVQQHPEADKLFIETLDDGTEEGRTIVSGLVGHYTAEELLNRTIVVVANLKPAKLRGVKSEGMLLAASAPDTSEGAAEGAQVVEVLFLQDVAPGTVLSVEGVAAEGSPAEGSPEHPGDQPRKRIKIDDFFAIPLRAVDGEVLVGESRILASGVPVKTTRVLNGSVG